MRVLFNYFLKLRPLSDWISRPISLARPDLASQLWRTEKISSITPIYSHPEINYLTPKEKKDLIENRVEKARLEYQRAKSQLEKHQIIQNYFASGPDKPEYLAHPVIRQFVIDSEKGDYYKTRALLSELRPNFAIGIFQANYIPELEEESLEAMTFDEADLSQSIIQNYPSNAVAIKNIKLSSGFSNEVFVALFPENFVVKDKEHRKGEEFNAYYLTDTFVKRFEKYTQPIIKAHAPGAFLALKNVNPEILKEAVGTWLSAHEHFHTTGPIPRVVRLSKEFKSLTTEESKALAAGFAIKDNAETGAFEEMRVDLQSLLSVSGTSGKARFGDNASFIRNFILAERLLRYPAQKDPAEHFDSIVALVMMNHLLDFEHDGKKALCIDPKNNQLILGKEDIVTAALEDLSNQVAALEKKIAAKYNFSESGSIELAQDDIAKFMHSYGRPKDRQDSTQDDQIFDKYKNDIKHLKKLIHQEKDLTTIRSLKSELKQLRAEYFQHFYPLDDDFHKKLRQTYKDIILKSPAPRKIISKNNKNHLLPQALPLISSAALHDNPVRLADYNLPVVRSNLLGVEHLLSTGTQMMNRRDMDRFYFNYLNSLSTDPKNLNSPEAVLQILAKQENFDGISRELIYFADLDEKNRLDEMNLSKYRQALNRIYFEQLQSLKSLDDKEKFIANIKRIFRTRLRDLKFGERSGLVKEWITKIENKRRLKRRTFLGLVGTSTGYGLAVGISGLVKVKKESINTSGVFNQDLLQVRENFIEGPMVYKVAMGILVNAINKKLLAATNIKKETGLIDTSLLRNGKLVPIIYSCNTEKFITINDHQDWINLSFPSSLIPGTDLADAELSRSVLQTINRQKYVINITPTFLPFGDRFFTMNPTYLGDELDAGYHPNVAPLISDTVIALLNIALKKYPNGLKGKVVDHSFLADGKKTRIQFSVQYSPVAELEGAKVVINPTQNDRIGVVVPTKLTTLIMKEIEKKSGRKFADLELQNFLDHLISDSKNQIRLVILEKKQGT